MADLVQILSALQSANNDTRMAAEKALDTLSTPDNAPSLLINLSLLTIPGSSSDQIRSFAAILLKRLGLTEIKDSDRLLLSTLSLDQVAALKNNLTNAIIHDNQFSRQKIGYAIAELFKYFNSVNVPWDVSDCIKMMTTSQDSGLRETAFSIINLAPIILEEIMCHQVEGIGKFLFSGLRDDALDVRVSALEATAALIINTETNTTREGLKSIVPEMMGVLPPILNAGNREDALTVCLSALIELAEAFPKLFRTVLDQAVPFMLDIMKNENIDESARQSCLEFLMTIMEQVPSMIKKQQNFVPAIIPILLNWMEDLEDDQSWYTTEDVDDQDNELNCIVAEQALDRIALSLKGTIVLPVAFSIIPSMLAAPEWQKRHAALKAVSAIGEGCYKIMKLELDKILSVVLPHLSDPHPRVRHAACNSIGQMCTDFCPQIEQKFHHLIVPALVGVMDDVQFPRVQAYGAAAMVNFSENAKKHHISPYLDMIFQRLLILLNTGKRYVQEQAITSIATVADSAGDHFVKYYSSIMPLLMNILRQATQREFRLLRGKTLECASLVALAVGKDVFLPDAAQFIEILKSIQESVKDNDDPQASYLLSAWARICKVLGHDFAPFLEFVLPPLFASAEVKPDFAVFEEDDQIDTEKYNEDDGWEFVSVEGQKIGIKTSILEDKCTAVEMLICYAQEMGSDFHPYVEKVLGIVLPLFKFYFHDGVRFAAASVIPFLFKSLFEAKLSRDKVLSTWHDVCDKMLNVIIAEPDVTYVAHMLESVHETISNMGKYCMANELIQKCISVLQNQISEYMTRKNEREDKRKISEYDTEDDLTDEEEDADEELLSQLSRIIHELFKAHDVRFFPFFEQLLPILQSFMASQSYTCRQWALCAFDDLIEFTGAECAHYQPQFLNHLIAGLNDEHPEIRQASSYGIGVAAQFGGEPFNSFCVNALEPLFSSLEAHKAIDGDDSTIFARENIISAIGKICNFHSNSFDVNLILRKWIELLPIVRDDEEAVSTYTYLLDLIEARHPTVAIDPLKVSSVLMEVLVVSADLFTNQEELIQRIVRVSSVLLSHFDTETRNKLWMTLDQGKQNKLKQYF